ncbi:polyketide synthase [Trichoderma arundinaceum]|uniref:Polyketide synthase n=1 Tax=Trichoderma arundinaceum TaxID=490622 RepID=A0A395NA74_TRIAR|nr:polyketide synthase [Trichoderma arundinaceum]
MAQNTDTAAMAAQAHDDIAVVGFSYRLPQDVNDDMSFWEVLDNRRSLTTDCPKDRMDAKSFLDTNPNKPYPRGAHFITDDVTCFDAPFFSVTAKEAASMDPMQRMTLETSYRAFEKAGFTTDALRGSQTAVFHASMLEDYTRIMTMDPDNVERSTITGGTVPCMVPNRISWYFDLRGPSVHVNTACSSGLVAVDMACKTLRSGDASCALVTGANLLLDPTLFHLLSNQNFLSPDSRSYSFEERGNGYARGEGIIAVVLKPVTAAVRDGDIIRAVIRASGSNQDGHTPVITQPSQQAQQELIQHVYGRANLSLADTRYVEAHGTGTPVGDPIEARAIGRVFRKFRSQEEPLYIGSVKSNIGHLEGASGLAGLLKVILSLERGVIAPNALFEKINPAIDADFWHIEIPTASIYWPGDGVRRASVNSFGFGGSNTHVVVDDALHYLKERNLAGNHCTLPVPHGEAGQRVTPIIDGPLDAPDFTDASGPTRTAGPDLETLKATTATASATPASDALPRLLVWSAADEQAVKRSIKDYELYYKEKVSGNQAKLDLLAYTLAARRSHMLWRSFAIVNNDGSESNDGTTELDPVKAVRSSAEATLAFVFTGQGAQYTDMGWELVRYPVFADTLKQIDALYESFGCTWSIFDELRSSKNIDLPQYSQPLSTAVQIALLELLASFGITPKAVVGHSSGEIAAAYAIGALSLESACKVSYFRGQLAGKLRAANAASPGAMMSINLSEGDVPGYLAALGPKVSAVCIACINSPLNCTLSGPETAIDALKVQADKDGIFAQKLKTGVAYHSPSMEAIADEYVTLMGSLDSASRQDLKVASGIPMVSSVSGKVVRPAALKAGQYWVNNMVSPVRFADAVQLLTQQASKVKIGLSNITDLVEIGSHPALRRVAQDTIRQAGNKKLQIRYSAALQRNHSPIKMTLELVGQLFSWGHNVSITAVNQKKATKLAKASDKPMFLIDAPEYPFDRSHKYWAESRISRDYRFRGNVKGDMLGARVADWNPLLPRWRNLLTVESIPWTGHHKVTDTLLYPAAGMLVMAIEAVQQVVPEDQAVAGFLIKEADFISPIIVHEKWENRTETQVHLRPAKAQPASNDKNGPQLFEIDIFSYTEDNWSKCFQATIQVDFEVSTSTYGKERKQLNHEKVRLQYEQATESCVWPIDSATLYRDAGEVGLQYGDWFQLVQDVCWDSSATAVARVDVSKDRFKTNSLVHPSVLDQAFHVLRVSAGQQPTANVPARLVGAWFASTSKWQNPETGHIRWIATSTSVANAEGAQGHGEQGTIAALADDGTVLCTIEQATTASISTDTKAKDKKLLYSTEWKPQFSLLDPEQMALVSRAESYDADETADVEKHLKIVKAMELCSARVLKTLDLTKVPESLTRHAEWMELHTSKFLTPEERRYAESMSDEEMEARLVEAETILPAWKLYTSCARNLHQMLSGEIDPLQVVFGSDEADIFYADLFEKLCRDGRLETILELAAHERPAQRILEVGAGTGGMTGHVLSLLQQREARIGGPSFSEYTYTDISPMFFEKASERWPDLSSQGRLSFKTFNMDKPIEDQGFEASSYDLVIAACVLHATPYLETSLRNVRKTLKPGGRLILLEIIDPDDVVTNFMAGLIPGWWVSREAWRPYSAAVPEKQWDISLRENGFSGNDVILRDYKSDACHIASIIITTAVEEPKPAPEVQSGRLVFVVDEQKSYRQTRLAELLQEQLNPEGSKTSSICAFSLDELLQSLDNMTKDDIVVCIAEVNNKPLLSNLSEKSFKCLQYLVGQAPKLLWVTASSTDDDEYADYGITQGFFRAIRVEQPNSQIISLAMEGKVESAKSTQFITKVFHESFGSSASKEVEYLVKDSLLMTGRAVEDVSGNETLTSLSSRQLQQKAWYDGPALQLSIGGREAANVLQFVRDAKYELELGPDEVEVDAKAWGVSHKDAQTALGRRQDFHNGIQLGVDCAGVVTRVGRDCDSSIKPGDRVCMVAPGCMRQYPRGSEKAICKIPESMSFEEATSALVPAMTAYQAIVDIARLEKEDKILIHAAASAVGQVAVRVAQMQGAEIIATYSTPLERDALKTTGLPEDHILDNTSITFTEGVMKLTDGYGVDVIFNLLSGEEAVQASCECLASGGRFLEANRSNVDANATLPIGIFDRNASFSIIDVLSLNLKTTSRLVKKAIELMEQGKVEHPKPLHCFNASEVEKAFQEAQRDDILGRVVIKPQAEDVVPKFIQEQRTWKFDAEASYVIAGGSGGLGRAIAKWMVERGAKNLILPSRSGAASKAAKEMLEELTARGVNIVAPKCDVASEKELAEVLDECARTMPPVKGCINAAMVLQGAVFQNSMTFAQWDLTMRSKKHTSQNLHNFLPKDLDFFVMLSSLAGVVGQLASANYSAGCSFQDALARQRIAQGQAALSLDIGWMRNIGIVAETEAYQKQRESFDDMKQIDDAELFATLAMYCDPASRPETLSQARGQVLFGLKTPVDVLAQGRNPPQLMDRPFFAPFAFTADSAAANASGANSNQEAAAGVRFRQASDSADRTQIVLRAFAAKLARAMAISSDDVELNKSLSHYGVDSLMSVDLRNWIGREFGALLTAFDIMGGASITKIADLVVERSTIGMLQERA